MFAVCCNLDSFEAMSDGDYLPAVSKLYGQVMFCTVQIGYLLRKGLCKEGFNILVFITRS